MDWPETRGALTGGGPPLSVTRTVAPLPTFEPGFGHWAITVPLGRELNRELKRGCKPSRVVLVVTAAFDRFASRGTRTLAWRLVNTTVKIMPPSNASTSANRAAVRRRPDGLRLRR